MHDINFLNSNQKITKKYFKKIIMGLFNDITEEEINKNEELAIDEIKEGNNFDPFESRFKYINRWYRSLKLAIPDYSVYDGSYYLAIALYGWLFDSKNYVKRLATLNYEDIETVIDFGCGIGFTTCALSEAYSEANIIGTNLKQSKQYKIARFVARKNDNIKIEHNYSKLSECDIAFCSEYFEHIENTIDHLESIIVQCNPRIFVVANGFNIVQTGHFNETIYEGKLYSRRSLSKLFSFILKDYGYSPIKTGFWNNRPSVWERN